MAPADKPSPVPLLNARIDRLERGELFDWLAQHGGVVHTINLDHYHLLQHHRAFYEAYQAANIVTADSHYVVAALRWLGRPPAPHITGSDFVPAFCAHHARNPAERVFLLGAKPGVAERARQRINARVGRELVVGALGPSMRFVDDASEIEAALAQMAACGATTVFVGLGAPKQEVFIHQVSKRLPSVKVWMGVGATLDYEADEVRRAPPIWGRMKMEWLYRVLSEPRRYGLRYLRASAFFWWVWLERRGRYRDPFALEAAPPGRP